ncbi:hypothetical protein TNCV_2563401 [Trichonephila clavipes]|nr:hypothetical protein TNCV_2563401 [Trichonephila clavipes]
MESDAIQELLNIHNQELIIDELIEMYEVSLKTVYKHGEEVENIVERHNYIGKHMRKAIDDAVRNVHRCPTRQVFSDTGVELMTKLTTILYLYHSATVAARAVRELAILIFSSFSLVPVCNEHESLYERQVSGYPLHLWPSQRKWNLLLLDCMGKDIQRGDNLIECSDASELGGT